MNCGWEKCDWRDYCLKEYEKTGVLTCYNPPHYLNWGCNQYTDIKKEIRKRKKYLFGSQKNTHSSKKTLVAKDVLDAIEPGQKRGQ